VSRRTYRATTPEPIGNYLKGEERDVVKSYSPASRHGSKVTNRNGGKRFWLAKRGKKDTVLLSVVSPAWPGRGGTRELAQ
jgi:hypothetical protein